MTKNLANIGTKIKWVHRILREFHTILKKIPRYLKENFTQHLREFYAIFRRISHNF